MTQRCLSIRLKEHATRLSSSAVGEHLSECEHAQYLVSLQNQFTLLNDLPLPSDNLSPIEILCNCKVLYFILSDDDFEIKSKIYSFNLRLGFEAYLAFSRCLFSEFAFYFTFLNCRLVMVFGLSHRIYR